MLVVQRTHPELVRLDRVSEGGCQTSLITCHNCAKHIVASGIRRVVYVEPYVKSQAVQLHGDAILSDDHGDPTPDHQAEPMARSSSSHSSASGLGDILTYSR
ncbi:MAG: hypothetical protein E6J90_35770 [Deltaproteobacteria bacterium]|nr:MAG: hypothetical protein E6J91_32230 [Deltaproteobacteria bacterium]TMQ10828.1 MAG: hypothetical protein E6J90_35770 [Deltaproteobacteria bacterium]